MLVVGVVVGGGRCRWLRRSGVAEVVVVVVDVLSVRVCVWCAVLVSGWVGVLVWSQFGRGRQIPKICASKRKRK